MTPIHIPEWFNAASFFVDRNIDEGRSNRTAILYGDSQITYGQVSEGVNRIGNALASLGVEMEHRVMLLLHDCPEFVYTFFGAMKIGAVPVPVNTLLQQQDYHYLLDDSRARVLVVSASLLPAVHPFLADLQHLKHVIVVGEAREYHSFDGLLSRASTQLAAARTNKDDVAFWLYTSGTTGRSRAAVHLHHDMMYSFELYGRGVLNMTADDRTFSVAKLFFAYGLGNSLYCPFGVGATTILFPGRPVPENVFAVVNRYRPTLFFSVPTSYAAMQHAAGNGASMDMSSVRSAVSAGESLPASVYARWRDRFGVEILDGIGTTEILHIFISNRPGQVRPGSTGTVVPGYEVKLVDDAGNPVPEGEIGNLWVKGDSICAYYWNKHDVTRQRIQGEWITSGDKYRQDADGYFWYAGRDDDMLKVGGIWVSPAEVENAVAEYPGVLECAVVGAQDTDSLIKPKAFVVLNDPHARNDGTVQAIQEFVKDRIAPYKYPRWVDFVDELPKTATGKIQRFKLRALQEEQATVPARAFEANP